MSDNPGILGGTAFDPTRRGETETAEEWRAGRLVNPNRPGLCVHLVGTSPGFWCSACLALQAGRGEASS